MHKRPYDSVRHSGQSIALVNLGHPSRVFGRCFISAPAATPAGPARQVVGLRRIAPTVLGLLSYRRSVAQAATLASLLKKPSLASGSVEGSLTSRRLLGGRGSVTRQAPTEPHSRQATELRPRAGNRNVDRFHAIVVKMKFVEVRGLCRPVRARSGTGARSSYLE